MFYRQRVKQLICTLMISKVSLECSTLETKRQELRAAEVFGSAEDYTTNSRVTSLTSFQFRAAIFDKRFLPWE